MRILAGRNAIAAASALQLLTNEANCQSYNAKETPPPIGDQCRGFKIHCLKQNQNEEDGTLFEAEREQQGRECRGGERE